MVLNLLVSITTGNDDLRGGSWADFILKLRSAPALRERLQFTGTGGLGPRSFRQFRVTFAVPDSFRPTDIEFFQIRNVSQESFGQTADNWDLRTVIVDIIPTPPPSVRVGRADNHRFDGSHRVLTVTTPRP